MQVDQLFLEMMDGSSKAIFLYNAKELRIIYANKLAKELYNTENNEDITKIFSLKENASTFLLNLSSQLKYKKNVDLYDLLTKTATDETKVSDVTFKFADDENSIIFAEFTFYEQTRMEKAIKQGELSEKAYAIVEFDDKLSVLYCNNIFHTYLNTNNELLNSNYDNSFLAMFKANMREKTLNLFEQKLQNTRTFSTEITLVDVNSIERCYHLDAKLRKLDEFDQKLIISLIPAEDNNDIFNVIQSLSEDFLYRLDIDKKIFYRSKETASFYKIPPATHNFPLSLIDNDIIHPDDVEGLVFFGYDLLKGIEGSYTVQMRNQDGKYEKYRLTFKKMLDINGKVKEMIGKAENIQEMSDLEKIIPYDTLTNTLNKNSFELQVNTILKRSSKNSRHALIFLDLDGFKSINDNLGHHFGDLILTTVGDRIKSLIRDKDVVSRIDCDEFLIFLDSCAEGDQIYNRTVKILNELSKEIADGNHTISVKASVGIALYPDHGNTLQNLLNSADTAISKSKKLEKDKITIYSE